MVILYLLSLILNFSSTSTDVDVTCNQLIEAVSNHKTGVITYCNRYKVPVVDSNGKMMFDIGLQMRGATTSLSMTPAMACKIDSGIKVTLTFTDDSQYQSISSGDSTDSRVEVIVDDKLRSKMMTTKILSVAFEGTKYPYNVVFKPNQGRVVQDILNCLQN